MLSKENLEKVNFNGLYSHEPTNKYMDYGNDVYWCKNWTFKPIKRDDKVYMADTYWSYTQNQIELTDDNIDEFEFIFDFNDVYPFRGENIFEFENEDYWVVAVDSGGKMNPKRFVRKNAKKNKEKVLMRLKVELEEYKQTIKYAEKKIKDIEDGVIDETELNYI